MLTGGLNRTDGAEPRGTINAVFEFLRLCGFRWYGVFTADSFGQFDALAGKPTANLPSCEGLTGRPSFGYRSVDVHNLLDMVVGKPMAGDFWWVQNHMNGGG